LGDRRGIEEKTTTWDKVIVDRQGDLSEWVSLLKKIQERRIMILAFANNHYALCRPRHKRIMPRSELCRIESRRLLLSAGLAAFAPLSYLIESA